jgi:CO/xanthine dehydrogenase Mo-binding subunit
MANDFRVIGNPALHDKQGIPIVQGKWDFSADHLPGRKLYGRILTCPHAHAIVTSIDTSKAEALEGVEAVVTHEDHPTWKEEKTYWGEEVAAVAAWDPDTAEEALSLIDVEYDVLNFELDPDEAGKPGAPLLGIWPDTNVRTTEVVRGDVEAGLAAADVIYETAIPWTQLFQHHEIEAQAALAYWIEDDVYLWCSAQRSTRRRQSVAQILNMPQAKVHVITHGTGGGWGDKGGAGDPVCILAATLSQKANGLPVQMHFSRYEHYLIARHQHPGKLDIKFGVKDDGTLTAIDATFYGDATGNGATWSGGLSFGTRSTWKCPDAIFKGIDICTNKPWTGAYRCVADPPGTFLMDCAIDELSEEMGMNPLEFRLKNMVTLDMVHQDTELPYSSLGVKECLEKAAEAVDFSNAWHAPGARTLPDGRLHGVGLSAHVDSHGGMSSQVSAYVVINRDATAMVNIGTSRAGGGTSSAITMMVSEMLGIPYDDVKCEVGDTNTAPDGGNQGGSTRVITLGAANYNAAQDAKAQLLDRAAAELEVPADQLDTGEGVVFVTANPAQSVPILDLVTGNSNGEIVGRGYSWREVLIEPLLDWEVGTRCDVRSQCAAAAEVAVDPETGEVEVLKFANACDMGKAIFYKGSENQIEGGSEHCWNEALMWEQIIDPSTGATLNPNDLEQKWPTTLDTTQPYEAVIVEPYDACGPYGAKGLGEPPVASYVAITNAIYNAIGIRINKSPTYAQDILKALGKA